MTRPVCEVLKVVRSRDLGHSYKSLVLGPYSRAGKCPPGTFVHIKIPSSDIFLRRAMSVAGADSEKKELEIIFKLYGRGTRLMGHLSKGDELNVLGPLGNRFRRPRKSETVLMVAGGVGFPPLLYFASELVSSGHDKKKILFFYGGRSGEDIIERSRIRKLGIQFVPTTDDGSFGKKGVVTDRVREYISEYGVGNSSVYGCGPEAMLAEVNRMGIEAGLNGQISLEAPMPCGVGICLGCVLPRTKGGTVRVCKEGPVFDIGEIVL